MYRENRWIDSAEQARTPQKEDPKKQSNHDSPLGLGFAALFPNLSIELDVVDTVPGHSLLSNIELPWKKYRAVLMPAEPRQGDPRRKG